MEGQLRLEPNRNQNEKQHLAPSENRFSQFLRKFENNIKVFEIQDINSKSFFKIELYVYNIKIKFEGLIGCLFIVIIKIEMKYD